MNKKLREQAALLASALAFCTTDDSTVPAIEVERILFGCEHYDAWQLAYETSWRSFASGQKERYAEAHAMLMNGEVD